MQLPPPKDISFLSYHKSSPKVMGERERPGGSVGWGGVRVNAAAGASQWMAVLAAGLLTFSLHEERVYATAPAYYSYFRDQTGGIKNSTREESIGCPSWVYRRENAS